MSCVNEHELWASAPVGEGSLKALRPDENNPGSQLYELCFRLLQICGSTVGG